MESIFRLLVLSLSITSCSSIDTQSNGKYSQDEINLFLRLALDYLPNDQHQNKIIKWDKSEVRIVTHGNPSDQDISNLNKLVSDLHAIVPQVHFLIVTEEPDIEIFFAPVDLFDDIFRRYDAEGATNRSWGAAANKTESGRIKKSILAIPNELTTEKYRCIVLRSLFIRSLGFNTRNFHESRFIKSVFSEYYNTQHTELVDYEKQMIRMIFEPQIKPDMTVSETKATLQKL